MNEKKPDDYHTLSELRDRALDLLSLYEQEHAPPDAPIDWDEQHARPVLDALWYGDQAMREARAQYEQAIAWLTSRMRENK